MEDVRPELELDAPKAPEEIASDKQAKLFTELCVKLGQLEYTLDAMQTEKGELLVKIRNANVAYEKAKKAETRAHVQEATPPEGVTQ